MKTVDIKGKAYVQVNERIIYFRSNYKGWRLTTEIVSLIEGVVTMKALIHNPVGELIATGYAQEKDGSTFINKTSFIENCETSAWGRALGNLGIGIDTSVASSDEVENAIANQNKKPKAKKIQKAKEDVSELYKQVLQLNLKPENVKQWEEYYSVKTLFDLDAEQLQFMLDTFNSQLGKGK
jgi:hypothetical protein